MPESTPPRSAPQISPCPPEERSGRDQINLLLVLIRQYSHRFTKAVSLIRHCQKLLDRSNELEPAEWIMIAVRDAALSVYHLSETLQAIRAGLGGCPTLIGSVSIEELRGARKDVASAFPDANKLRNAVAHSAEILATPEKIAKLRTPGKALFWETLAGTHFTMLWQGQRVELHVDEESSVVLDQIVEKVFRAFAVARVGWIEAHS